MSGLGYGDVEWLDEDFGTLTVTHGLKIFHVAFGVVGAEDDAEIEALEVDSDEEPEEHEIEAVEQFVSSIPYSRLVPSNPLKRGPNVAETSAAAKKFFLYVTDASSQSRVKISDVRNNSLGVLLFVGSEKNVTAMGKYIKGLYLVARKYKFTDLELSSTMENVVYLLSEYTQTFPSDDDDAKLERIVEWWKEIRKKRSVLESYFNITTAFLNEITQMNRSLDLIFLKVEEGSRFDVISFRKDHPELYERYKVPAKRELLTTTKPVVPSEIKKAQVVIFSSFVEANRVAKQMTIDGQKVLVKRVEGGFSVIQQG